MNIFLFFISKSLLYICGVLYKYFIDYEDKY